MSADAGFEAKRIGQAQAASTKVTWTAQARSVAIDLASRGEFTSDDVTDIVGLPSGSEGANKNNAVGSLFSGLVRGKHIEPTGEIRPCKREVAHASDQRVWQAYTGLEEHNRALLAVIEKWMVPLDVTTTGASTSSKGERYAQRFAADVRKAWGDIE